MTTTNAAKNQLHIPKTLPSLISVSPVKFDGILVVYGSASQDKTSDRHPRPSATRRHKKSRRKSRPPSFCIRRADFTLPRVLMRCRPMTERPRTRQAPGAVAEDGGRVHTLKEITDNIPPFPQKVNSKRYLPALSDKNGGRRQHPEMPPAQDAAEVLSGTSEYPVF